MFKRFLTAIFAALAFIACVETSQVCEDFVKMSFESSFSIDDTKTVLVDRTHVYWQDGDQIAVSGAAGPFVTSLSEDSPTASFTGEVLPADIYYAVSPYAAVEEWADEVVLLNLPTEQQAIKGTFGPEINIAVASTPSMENSFTFHNVLSYVKLSIGAGAGKINSITVMSPAGEALTGSFYVDCTEDEPVAVPEDDMTYVTLSSDNVLEEGDFTITSIFPHRSL